MNNIGDKMYRLFNKIWMICSAGVVNLIIVMLFFISPVTINAEQVETESGWQYEKMFPFGYAINDVRQIGDELFAVGDDGLILHYQNQKWEKLESGIDRNLKSIWGDSVDNIYAVGTYNVLHYDGSHWKPIDSDLGKESDWGNVVGIGDEIFIVGKENILHNQSGKWNKMNTGLTSGDYLSGLWGESSSNMYAVGGSIKGKSIMLHYDGEKWTNTDFIDKRWINAIFGFSSDNIYAVGQKGLLLHYDGNKWTTMKNQNYKDLTHIWGDSKNNIYFAGSALLHYDGKNIQEINITNQPYITSALWRSLSNEIFMSTLEKTVYKLNAQKVEIQNPKMNQVFALDAHHAFAVGEYGTIRMYDGITWELMESNTTKDIYSIWGDAKDNMFAVGSENMILHFNGEKWISMDSHNTSLYKNNLNGIWGSSGSNIYAVGGKGAMFHYDGSIWKPIKSGTHENLFAIYGTSENNIYAAGNDVLHYDGSIWKTIKIPNRQSSIRNIFAISEDNVYFLNGIGIHHYNGSIWNKLHYPRKNQTYNIALKSIYGVSETIYAAVTLIKRGETIPYQGFIAKYDGKTWKKLDAFDFTYLTSLTGINGKPLFIAGEGGCIGAYRPSSKNQHSAETIEELDRDITVNVDEEAETKSVIDLRKTDKYGRSELHLAVSSNNLLKIKQLLDSGSKIDVEDKFGRTPLHYAAFKGYVMIAKVLLDYGAKMNAIDKTKQWTPLFFAYYNKHSDMVSFLLEKGADKTIKDKFHRTVDDYEKEK